MDQLDKQGIVNPESRVRLAAQRPTVYQGALMSDGAVPEAAREFIRYLASPEARDKWVRREPRAAGGSLQQAVLRPDPSRRAHAKRVEDARERAFAACALLEDEGGTKHAARLQSQIRALDAGVGQQRVVGAVERDAPGLQDVAAIAGRSASTARCSTSMSVTLACLWM